MNPSVLIVTDTAVVRDALHLREIRATPVVVLSRCNTGQRACEHRPGERLVSNAPMIHAVSLRSNSNLISGKA